MRRVHTVNVLVAVGLALFLAACSSSSDSGLKRDLAAAEDAAATAQAAAEEAAAAQLLAEEQAAADRLAAEAAAAAQLLAEEQAAADRLAAEAAAAAQLVAEEALANAPKPIGDLTAVLAAAGDVLSMKMTALADADTALADATTARMEAQAAVNANAASGEELAPAIEALQMAINAESVALQNQIAATVEVSTAQAAVDTAQAAVDETDQGPAKETLTEQEAAADVAGARKAFTLLTVPALAPVVNKMSAPFSAKHDGSAVTFKATGWTTSDVNMAPAITGWASGSLKGKDGTNNADANVYSNISAPTSKLYANLKATEKAVGTPWTGVVIPTGNKYTGSTNTGSIMGSFMGAEGRFNCTANCTTGTDIPTRRSNGSIISLPGTWAFTPTDPEARVTVQDADYLAFGYWLSKDSDGDPVGFAVWYGGKGGKRSVAVDTDYNLLDEKVTFKGAAAGKYVTKDDLAKDAQAGYFTATAELEADLTDATRMGGTYSDGSLKGTISGFDAPLGDLKLTLGTAALTHTPGSGTAPHTAVVDAAAGATKVTATLGGVKHPTSGDWEAELVGTQTNTNLPTGVVGAFDATIGQRLTVIGGFGAEKVE